MLVVNEVGVPALPNFLELVCKAHVIESDGLERPVYNVYHYHRQAGTHFDLEASIITAWDNTVEPALLAALNPSYQMDSQTVRYMDDPARAAVEVTDPSVATGTAGDRLPMQSAVTVLLNAGVRGRGTTGSKHFAPVSEADTTLDELSGVGITRFDALGAACESALGIASGDSWEPIILYKTRSDLNATPSVFTYGKPLVHFLDVNIGTMRKRREKGSHGS